MNDLLKKMNTKQKVLAFCFSAAISLSLVFAGYVLTVPFVLWTLYLTPKVKKELGDLLDEDDEEL